MDTIQLKRIADALEEILRLVNLLVWGRTKKEKAARRQSCKLQAPSSKHPGNANWNIFDQL